MKHKYYEEKSRNFISDEWGGWSSSKCIFRYEYIHSDEQNLGQVHSCRIDARSFENVRKLRPKLHALTNSGQITLRGCLLPTFFSSGLLFTNITIKILKITTLYLALYGYETGSSTLRGDRLRVLEIRTLRKIFGPKAVTITEG